jgi:hypothetical protein
MPAKKVSLDDIVYMINTAVIAPEVVKGLAHFLS